MSRREDLGYRIWFERRVTPELMPFVPPSVDMLGPERDGDPLAGISTARAALAARLDYDDNLFDRAPDLLGVFPFHVIEEEVRSGLLAVIPSKLNLSFGPVGVSYRRQGGLSVRDGTAARWSRSADDADVPDT